MSFPIRAVRWSGVRATIVEAINAAVARSANRCTVFPNIGNGGTNGRLRTNAAITFSINGTLYSKASTDDLWNLSAQTATTGAQYRAIRLYLNDQGAASIEAGSNAATADAALAALPDQDLGKCVVGVFVAGPSTNFANALAAQGTIYNGHPSSSGLLTLGAV